MSKVSVAYIQFPLGLKFLSVASIMRANRILLLIRRLEAERLKVDEATLFGPLPAAKVFLTHDIDALDKTLQIRLKQSVFELFNLVRYLIWTLGRCW